MGAWGYGVFENDIACDWVYELLDSADPVAFLGDALNPEGMATYLEVDSGTNILAASETIRAITTGMRENLTPELSEWVVNIPPSSIRTLAPQAINAINHVISANSELNELWAEDEDEYAKWRTVVDELVTTLTEQP